MRNVENSRSRSNVFSKTNILKLYGVCWLWHMWLINIDIFLFFCVPVSRPCSVPTLWGDEVPTSDSGYSSPRIWVPGDNYLRLMTRYECQRKETISYTDYSTTDTNTIENEQRTEKWGTNSTRNGSFSYLACDTRDIVLTRQNNLRIDHYR